MSDTGIVNLLFSPSFFRVSGHTSLFCDCENSWTEIWNQLTENGANMDWIPACVVSQLKLGKVDLSYLLRMNEWIHEVFEINPIDLEKYIKSGLLEEMLEGIISQYSSASHEFVTDFFISLKSIISICDVSVVSAKLVLLMLQEDLIYDNQVSELVLTCLAILMRQQEVASYKKYLAMLQQARNFEVQKKLLESVQSILNDSESRRWCQENFVEAGVLKIIKEILENSYLEESAEPLWVCCMECIRFIIQGNESCKARLEALDIPGLARMLFGELFKCKRVGISEKTTETLLLILFNTTNLETSQEVANPYVVPLLITMMTIQPSGLCGFLVQKVKNPYNAALISMYSALEFLLEGLNISDNANTVKFISEMIGEVAAFHINPVLMKKVLSTSCKVSAEKQLVLFRSLNKAFDKVFSPGVFSGFTIEPDFYSWFFHKESRIECFSSDFEFLPKKEFSVVVWVYVSVDAEGCIWEFTEKKSQFYLNVDGYMLSLALDHDKKNFFIIKTGKCLVPGSWNLVCVSCQQVSKLMSHSTNFEIVVNGKICEKVIEGKLNSIHSFNSLFIGNDSSFSNSFKGKLAFFVVLNKFITDYSSLLSLDNMSLAFIPESISGYENFDRKLFKDFSSNKHFEYFSHIHSSQHSISICNYSMIVNQGSIIHSLSSIGGLSSLFPIFKESNLDQEQVLSILSLLSTLSKSRSLSCIINKDFFEILGNVLETSIFASKSLLNITASILENIDWNVFYQKKVFTYVLCNPKIWSNMDDELSENYLKVISAHVSKHFECSLTNVTYLYSHLILLNPVPSGTFVQFFIKILPHNKKIAIENMDAITFLLFRIIRDCPQIMQYFLEELSIVMIDKKCAQDFGFLILHILEWGEKFCIQSGAIRVVKTVLVSLTGDVKDKKVNSEFCGFVFAFLDKKLPNAIGIDVFQALMDIIVNGFVCGVRDDGVLFELFADIICKRFPYLDDKIREELNKATTDYQFCELIIARDTFPAWLYDSYLREKDNTIEFSLNIFKQTCNKLFVCKLRQFLQEIAQYELNESLKFYHRVLMNLKHFGNFESIACFLDFSSIIEDLINPDISKNQDLDVENFTSVLSTLIDQASILSLLQCTFPSLPKYDFSTHYDLLRQKPSDSIRQDSTLLREGGFLRLILKYLLISIQKKPSPELISLLRSVLTSKTESSSIILLDSLSKQASDRVLIELNPDRFSSSYSKFPAREADSLFSEEFLSFYLLVELTEIISTRYDDQLFDFLLKLLQDTCIEKWLVSWSKRVTSKELEDFYRTLTEFKYSFYVTSRSRLPQMERCTYLALTHSIVPQSLNTFQYLIYEQAENLGMAKKLSNSLKELLTSPAWVTKVHFYLLAYTSMKLNFISIIAKTPRCKFPSEIVTNEEYQEKLTGFITSKQEELKQWQMNFNQSQDKFSSLYKQKFTYFTGQFMKIENLFAKGKVKLRWVSDQLGRNANCIQLKNKQRFSFKRSKSVNIPTEQRFKASVIVSTSTESSVGEESETGTLVNEVDEETVENIPQEKQKIVKMDCERIKVAYSLYGDLELCKLYLLFVSEGKEKPTEGKYFGSALKFTQETKKSTKYIEPDEVSEIFARRFIHKHTAFELFLKSGRSYLFNVFNKEQRDEVFEVFKTWRHVKLIHTENVGQYLRSYQKKWKSCEISNFEYLMIVNKAASRSFNDISQYPVFPWIIKDYYSPELKLEDQHIYRNLKLPIGAQNDAGRQEADRRFSMWIDEQPYHFGSHYSSGAIVLYYLIRIEPFTTQSKILQGGKFDVADRLFHSIQACWESGQGSNGDVKELIPEMFYLPELLVNLNREDFGCKQDEETVQNVELPRWAESPIDFIRKHRAALESSFVSSTLNSWIDLVFGFKQKGKQAQNSYNLFCPMTYEENFTKVLSTSTDGESYLQGMIDQVVHFGQTPVKVFKSPHPVRDLKPPETNIFEKYKKLHECVYYGCETNGEICSLLITSRYLIMIKNIYGRISIIRVSLNEIEYNRVLFDEKKEKILEGCDPLGPISQEYFDVFNEKRIISGCQIDRSVKVHTLNGNLEASLIGHTDYASCVHCTKLFIVSGSRDSTMVSWEESKEKSQKFQLRCRFLGHDSEIIMIRSLESYQILFSLGKNGKLLLHDLRSGEGLKGIATEAVGFTVSNLGIICYYTYDTVFAVTINEFKVLNKKIEVSRLMFDNSGENLFYFYGSGWGFFNVFDSHKFYYKDEQMPLIHIQLPLGNEYIIFAKATEKMNYVFTYEMILKETFKVIRKHNIFQDL